MKKNLLVIAVIFSIILTSCVSKKDLEKLDKRITQMQFDEDDDGVPDVFDKQLATEPSVKVYGDGTPVDTDMDGVPDYQDYEIYSPKGVQVDTLGIAVRTEAPKEEQKEEKIITPIPVPQYNISEKKNLPIVLFRHSFELEEFSYPALVEIFNYMKDNPSKYIVIIGHCDNVGSDDYNVRLGLRRAETVVKALANLGVPEERMVAVSAGETDPLVDVTAFNMINFNRRVEFKAVTSSSEMESEKAKYNTLEKKENKKEAKEEPVNNNQGTENTNTEQKSDSEGLELDIN